MMFEKIRKLLADQLCIDESQIEKTSSLVQDLGADSLDLVQLLILLEKEFGLTFADEQIKSIVTVNDVVTQIEKAGK